MVVIRCGVFSIYDFLEPARLDSSAIVCPNNSALNNQCRT